MEDYACEVFLTKQPLEIPNIKHLNQNILKVIMLVSTHARARARMHAHNYKCYLWAQGDLKCQKNLKQIFKK